jgi:hypothetical protein
MLGIAWSKLIRIAVSCSHGLGQILKKYRAIRLGGMDCFAVRTQI